jgi:glycoprotein endo-alpha-1,2-mannosidase
MRLAASLLAAAALAAAAAAAPAPAAAAATAAAAAAAAGAAPHDAAAVAAAAAAVAASASADALAAAAAMPPAPWVCPRCGSLTLGGRRACSACARPLGRATEESEALALAREEGATGASAFFYMWYGTPEVDGRWVHWDHSQLPHWRADVRARFPPESVRWLPPDDLHSPFFPQRGPYSSRDAAVLREQFEEMRGAGIDTAIVSWWGRPDGSSAGDSQGVVTDAALLAALDAARLAGVSVALHLEPYAGRSVESVRADLAYLAQTYFAHPAIARRASKAARRGEAAAAREPPGGAPWVFVYDSYHIAASEWARLLGAGGDLSVRGSPLDVHATGLWLTAVDGEALAAGGFDGAYTYFAAEGFSHGATSTNWAEMAGFCRARGMAFAPSVGPGYDDTKIRPWNTEWVRARNHGDYYRGMWERALASGADEVSVVSWNEWGEGTQVEPAAPRRVDVDALAPLGRALNRTLRAQLQLAASDAYQDYEDAGGPRAYLHLTSQFAQRLRRARGPRLEAERAAAARRRAEDARRAEQQAKEEEGEGEVAAGERRRMPAAAAAAAAAAAEEVGAAPAGGAAEL